MRKCTSYREEYISLPHHGKTFIRWDEPTFSRACLSSSTDTPAAHATCRKEIGIPIILMLHGATVPHWQFDNIVPHLTAEEGGTSSVYRTLRIDFYGHGDSAYPDTTYDIALLIDQVLGVLSVLYSRGQISKSTPLIGLGHSLGAAVLAGVAASSSSSSSNTNGSSGNIKFGQIILVAPLLNYKELNPHTRLLSIPVLGEVLMECVIIPQLRKRRRRRYDAIGCGHLGEAFVQQSMKPGFSRALLRMFRDGCVDDQAALYRALASMTYDVRVMWGSDDTVASEKQIFRILHMIQGGCAGKKNDALHQKISWEIMNGLGHNLLMSHPKQCADSIRIFLDNNSYW